MRWAWRRRTSFLVLPGVLALAPGCGLLASRPRLPGQAAVARARAAQQEEWRLLEEAVQRYAVEGPAVLPVLRREARERNLPRLAALAQDLAVQTVGAQAVLEQARRRHAEDPDPWNAWLLARVQPDRERARALLEEAVAGDPDLLQARILQLGLEARAGDDRVLDRIVELLARDPGAAEAWRLLGRLAPLYGRRDLALAAAETEPWSPLQDPRAVRLLQARAALDHGRSGRALEAVAALPPEDREASLLRAAALAQGGHYPAARQELERLLRHHPDDLVARFDLGLLALDYLGDPELARDQFRRVLDLAAAGATLPLQRRLQAEMWLARAEAALAAPGAGEEGGP